MNGLEAWGHWGQSPNRDLAASFFCEPLCGKWRHNESVDVMTSFSLPSINQCQWDPWMSRKSIKQMFTHPTPGGPASWGGWGSTFQKCGKFHELPRKSIKQNSAEKITKTCNPHPTPSDGGGVRGENFKVTKLQGLKSISGMQLSWAKPGNPREGG